MDEIPDNKIVEAKPLKVKSAKRKNRFLVKFKRRLLRHVWIVRVGIVFGIALFVYLFILLIGLTLKTTGADYYLFLASDFVFNPSEKIQSYESKTNILVLGKGGADHEAPELTDTMIFVSIDHDEPKIVMISLPRDIWIPELRAKLNSTYYWGNKKQDGGGVILTKSAVEEIIGQPIHYSVVVDFAVFEKIIDEIGGVNVDVKTAFTDTKYPIYGKENDDCNGDTDFMCRYETIVFEKGLQYMDSNLALKFVRSRNAKGDEGTDFARSIRQQLVIKGIQEKILTKEILLSPEKIRNLMEIAILNTQTNLDPSSVAILARRVYDGKDSISTNIIPEELLINPPINPKYDNLYVFTPRTMSEDGSFDWEEINNWADCKINQNCSTE